MSWGSAAGVVVLTTVAGGCAAAGLAAFLIQWLQISNFEGGSGYFAVIVTLFGAAGGFIVGLVTALTVHSGFWPAQAYATGIVAALTIAAGVLTVALHDNGPRIDGEKVVLEVELKCPRDWKPDNYARSELGSAFRLQENADTATSEFVLGGLTFQPAAEFDGQWVVACAVDLNKTRGTRYVNVRVGNKTDVTIQIPLPRHPGPRFQQWSECSKVAVGYEFRFRIQRKSTYDQAHPNPRVAFLKARRNALEAMPADAPIAQWLPFFEDDNQRTLASEPCEHPEVQAVNARPGELGPLLRSSDPAVVRRAVFAAAVLTEVPASLIEPLAVSGRHTLELIHRARANSLPNDPDLVAEMSAFSFFFYWADAMERAGNAAIPARRAVLEQIDGEVRGDSGHGGFRLIADQTAKDLEKLGSAAH